MFVKRLFCCSAINLLAVLWYRFSPLHVFSSPPSCFTVLKNKGDQYFINGNLSIDTPRRFNAAGTTFYYRRPTDGPETLEALGPTNMSLVIMVRQAPRSGRVRG